MIGRKVEVIPNDEPPKEDAAQDAQPNTGQGDTPDPRAVGAGPGNSLQANDLQPAYETQKPRLQPGAQPEGELSGVAANPRNEGIEQADQANRSESID